MTLQSSESELVESKLQETADQVKKSKICDFELEIEGCIFTEEKNLVSN